MQGQSRESLHPYRGNVWVNCRARLIAASADSLQKYLALPMMPLHPLLLLHCPHYRISPRRMETRSVHILTKSPCVGHKESRWISIVLFVKRRGMFAMTELIRMHNMRQMVRNEQESIPVQVAQELLHLLVAEVCMGFPKAWNPHPSFFSG
jgi:hypothetical protein